MVDNWALIPCHNNSDLLQACLLSVLNQTIPVRIFAINNSSVDNTDKVLAGLDNKHIVVNAYPQLGVAGAWNYGLEYLFGNGRVVGAVEAVEKVLVINQDVILRPNTYEILLSQDDSFVTAVSTGDRKDCRGDSNELSLHSGQGGRVWNKRNHPDFSCFLIERDCYRTVGPFDEAFYPAWFEDNDYHIRMGRAGIEACCIDLPFYHYAGGTIKRAREVGTSEPYEIAFRANQQKFYEKWGVLPGTKEYEELCQVKK